MMGLGAISPAQQAWERGKKAGAYCKNQSAQSSYGCKTRAVNRAKGKCEGVSGRAYGMCMNRYFDQFLLKECESKIDSCLKTKSKELCGTTSFDCATPTKKAAWRWLRGGDPPKTSTSSGPSTTSSSSDDPYMEDFAAAIQAQQQSTQQKEEDKPNYLLWAAVGGVALFLILRR